MRKDKSRKQAVYGPTGRKTFHSALRHLLESTFPGQFSGDISDLFAHKVEDLYGQFHPDQGHMQVGRVLWSAVAVDDPPARGKTIENTRLVPVVLELLSPEDIDYVIAQGTGVGLRRRRVARILQQAYEQGGVLSCADVALMLGVSASTIARDVREVEEQKDTQLPRRGTVHDLGCSVTHKATICYKRLVEKKPTSQVASETNHAPEGVEYYVQCFQRVRLCMDKGMSTEEISLATGHGTSLVEEYLEMIEEYFCLPSQAQEEPTPPDL